MQRMYSWLAAAAVVSGLAAPAVAVSVVTSKAQLGANDATNFAALLPAGGTFLQTAPPVVHTTPGGLGVQLNSSDPDAFWSINANPTFDRDFLPDTLQIASSSFDTVNIAFSSAVRGMGTQVTHAHFGPYLTVITAYDAANNSLGSFSLTATENNSADGSALYIGVKDDNPVIARVSLQVYEGTAIVDNPSNQDGAIFTNLDLLTGTGDGGTLPPPDNGGGSPPPVPEPAALGILAIIGGALTLGRRLGR